MTQRELSLDILYKTIKDSSYSNLLMRRELEKVPVIQRAFCTKLINGVLRNYEILNYQFEKEVKKASLKLKLILCMALYERFFLNEKDYVVNNEYVDLAKNKYDKSFVNAVLHKVNEFKLSDIGYIDNNLPEWIYNLLKKQYSEEELKNIFKVYQNEPKVYYRLNKSKCSFDLLKDLDIEIVDDSCFTSKMNLLKTSLYDKGYFYVQDYNSSTLFKHLDLKSSDVLLDVCSAPGSKLFNCLDVVKPQNAYSNEYHSNRVELIKRMANKLGFEGINYLNYDGRDLDKELDVKFDKILMDVPCSGLGVISRKPDLKFHISPNSLDELEKIQEELLESCHKLLKNDGIIVYSTCTLNKKENEKQIAKFLKTHQDFSLIEDETIINDMGDCFYYAKIKKII